MFRGLDIRQVRVLLALLTLIFGGTALQRYLGTSRPVPVRSRVIESSPHIRPHEPGVLVPRQEVAAATPTPTPKPAEKKPATKQGLAPGAVVDLNTADQATLELLPGIGPGKALTILEDRTANGPFRGVEDLLRVSGIGEKTLEKLRPFITASDVAGYAPAPPPKVAATKVRMNHASAEELEQLKGVGEVTAQKIILQRAMKGPFRRPEDLLPIDGIGTRFIEQNRQMMVFD